MSLMPLDLFRQFMGLNPWHFWGMADGSVYPVNTDCPDLTYAYTWQALQSNQEAVGRDEIQRALDRAEDRLREYLRYSVGPRYRSETVEAPRYLDHRLWRIRNIDANWRWISVQLEEGYIQQCGVEVLTLLATPTLVYADTDGDGINDTWHCQVNTTETDPAKIVAYIAASDRLSFDPYFATYFADADPLGDRYKVQPIQVSIVNGVATISGRTWLVARPRLYEGSAGLTAIDPTKSANLVTTLEIYDRTADQNQHGSFIWETPPYPMWLAGCLCNSVSPTGDAITDPAATATVTARVGIRDARMGVITPGEALYDPTTQSWNAIYWHYTMCRPPDRMLINYLGGYPLGPDGQIDRKFQPIVARFAAAELNRPVCKCSAANQEIYRWTVDEAMMSMGSSYKRMSSGQVECPFGTRAGQLQAWNFVRANTVTRGMMVG